MDCYHKLYNQDLSMYKNQINKISIYFDYANYLWTNKFINYDGKARSNFIENKIKNLNFVDDLYFYFILVFSFIIFLVVSKILIQKRIYFNIFFNKMIKINDLDDNNYTHQEILKKLEDKQKNNWKDIFNFYEKIKFSKNYKVKFFDFIKINLRILKI